MTAPWWDDVIGPRTKGLALDRETTVRDLLASRPRITDDIFSWPLLTLDATALDHNMTLMARLCAERGVEHAPHVKTTMARGLYDRQARAGAWGATVATPAQLRAVRSWGAERVVLANELLDPREIRWLRAELERSARREALPFEMWCSVDSADGVAALVRGFTGATADVIARLGVLVELGVPGGRTGVRTEPAALELARSVRAHGLRLLGVTGYEGSVAGGTSPAELDAVHTWCRSVRELAARLVGERLAGVHEPVVMSAGGSSFLDVVLDVLPRSFSSDVTDAVPVRVVVRSGAYVTHDDGFYSRTDPWARIPGSEPMRAAATVWGQVLSTPEPGIALCGAGRRDVSFDIDLPVARSIRRVDGSGWLPPVPLTGVRVTALNDQHLYLAWEPASDVPVVRPGDVIGFGISHPCTTFDRWRIAAVVGPDDEVVDLVTTDF